MFSYSQSYVNFILNLDCIWGFWKNTIYKGYNFTWYPRLNNVLIPAFWDVFV